MKRQKEIIDGNQNILIKDAYRSKIKINMVLGGFLNYQELLKERNEIVELLTFTDVSAVELRIRLNNKLHLIDSKIEQVSSEAINLASSFVTSTISNARFTKAKTLFAKGKFQLANKRLNENEINHDYKLYQEIKIAKEEELAKIQAKIAHCADEFIIKGKLAELAVGTDAESRINSAERYFLRALEIHPSAEIKLSVGQFYKRNLNFGQAEQIFKELKAEVNKLPLELHVQVCKELGDLALEQCSSECLAYYNESIALCEQLILSGDKKYIFWLADSFSDSGNFYSSIGNLLKSREMFQKAIAIRTKTKFIDNDHNSYNQSKSLYNLGLVLFDLKEFDSAIIEFHKAIEHINQILELKDFQLLHKKQILKWLGMTYYQKYRREEAIDFFLQQIEVAKGLQSSYPNLIKEIAETQWLIGSKYDELGLMNKAFEYFKYCVDNVRIMYNANLISSSKYLDQYLLNIASTLIARSQQNWAKVFLDEAIALTRDWNDTNDFYWLKTKADYMFKFIAEV